MESIANPTSSITRPADTTAYAAGDLIANDTTAGNVVFPPIRAARGLANGFMLRRLKLEKTSTGGTNPSFRVRLFRGRPTPSNGDNGAHLTDGRANFIGSFDVTMDQTFTDGMCGIGTPNAGSDVSVKLADGADLYWTLSPLAAYTPASGEVFTLTLEDWQ